MEVDSPEMPNGSSSSSSTACTAVQEYLLAELSGPMAKSPKEELRCVCDDVMLCYIMLCYQALNVTRLMGPTSPGLQVNVAAAAAAAVATEDVAQ
jgi:hypothetical protein